MAFRNKPDIALLVLRAMVGTVGVFHGSQKLFGLFGGDGVQAFAEHLRGLNIPLPLISAICAGAAEAGCGLLVGIGLATRVAVLPFAFVMMVAIWTHRDGGFDAGKGGFEYPLTILAILVAIFLSGPGRFSADHVFRSKGGE